MIASLGGPRAASQSQVAEKRRIQEEAAGAIELLNLEVQSYPELDHCEHDLALLDKIWTMKRSWDVDFFGQIKISPFKKLDIEDKTLVCRLCPSLLRK